MRVDRTKQGTIYQGSRSWSGVPNLLGQIGSSELTLVRTRSGTGLATTLKLQSQQPASTLLHTTAKHVMNSSPKHL